MNPNQAPRITIGITCYNAADTIGRAINGARAQDWPNKEIIVIDDGSTDDSRNVLAGLMKLYGDIRVIAHENNRGYPGALNTLIAAASGDYVAIFDDDDVSVPNRLRKQLARIADYERKAACNLILCYSNRNVVKAGQRSVNHVTEAIGRGPLEPRGRAVADYLFGHRIEDSYVWGMFGSCTLMARRSTYITIGQFDESFRRCAEWDFAVRGGFLNAHFIAVNEPLITQYKTATSDKSGKIPLKYALLLREKHRAYLKSEKAYLASRFIARSRFYGAEGHRTLSSLYMAVAAALFPRIAIKKLKKIVAVK